MKSLLTANKYGVIMQEFSHLFVICYDKPILQVLYMFLQVS